MGFGNSRGNFAPGTGGIVWRRMAEAQPERRPDG